MKRLPPALTIAIGLAAVAGGCSLGSAPSEDEVRQAIEAANHCKSVRECKVVHLSCPFPSVVINAGEADRIEGLADRYATVNGTCVYSALDRRDFSRLFCDGNKCDAALKRW